MFKKFWDIIGWTDDPQESAYRGMVIGILISIGMALGSILCSIK